MTAVAAQAGLETPAQQFTAESPAMDLELEALLGATQPSVLHEASPQVFSRGRGASLIGNVALADAQATPLSEIIGAPARARVVARYSAMLGRISDALSHRVRTALESDRPDREIETRLPQPPSTISMFESADRGEERGRSQLLMNVSTHTGEIFGQTGVRLVVRGKIEPSGQIEQFGQAHEDRQELTLFSFPDQPSALREAVHAEGRTAFSIEEGRKKLNQKKVVEVSAMPDEADAKTLDSWHYYLAKMTAVARFTEFENDEAITVSILLGGVDPESVEPLPENHTEADEQAWHERLLAARYDIRVLGKVRRHLGLETPDGMTANQMLADAFAIDAQFDEIDFAMLYDAYAADEVVDGKQTFFGAVELWREYGEPEELTRALYEKRLTEVDARAAERRAMNERAVDLVLKRYRALTDVERENLQPIDASNMLRKATLDTTVREAVITYQDADLPNLGTETWGSIQAGRTKWNSGDREGAERDIEHGQETAVDPACPTGPNSKSASNGESDNDNDDRDELGSRRFRCRKGHLNYRRVRNVPEKTCHVCGVDVSCEPPKPQIPKTAAGRTSKVNILAASQERYGKVRNVTGWLSLNGA